MGKQQSIDDKANTPAQGAEGAAETVKPVEENQPVVTVVETPEYVQTILESNAKVIESNQAVIDSLAELKDLAKEAEGRVNSGERSRAVNSEQEVDLKASYVVAEGKSFRDSKDFTKEYKAGDDVTAFDEVVLKRLLNQGMIEAVEEED